MSAVTLALALLLYAATTAHRARASIPGSHHGLMSHPRASGGPAATTSSRSTNTTAAVAAAQEEAARIWRSQLEPPTFPFPGADRPSSEGLLDSSRMGVRHCALEVCGVGWGVGGGAHALFTQA